MDRGKLLEKIAESGKKVKHLVLDNQRKTTYTIHVSDSYLA